MADNGADVVISQHTHAVGEEERYNGAYLLYGQGNFCFHFRSDVTPLLAEGLILELVIMRTVSLVGLTMKRRQLRKHAIQLILLLHTSRLLMHLQLLQRIIHL